MQAIVEHPYGTIKRQWGFSYVSTKKYLERASADIGLMMLAYNLRRIINLIGMEVFREYLRVLISCISNTCVIFERFWASITNYNFRLRITAINFNNRLKTIYLIQKLNFSGGF